MAKKDRKATDQINVSLAGVEGLMAVLGELDHPVARKVAADTKVRCDEIRDALLTIQFHAAQI